MLCKAKETVIDTEQK